MVNSGASAAVNPTYQWKEEVNGKWVDMGATTGVPTKKIKSSTAAVRKFKVIRNPNSKINKMESAPVYVVWDEWGILVSMLKDLQKEVSKESTYSKKQSALLSCMNTQGAGIASVSKPTPTFTSFDHILSNYTGFTKSEDGVIRRLPHPGERYVQFSQELIQVQVVGLKEKECSIRSLAQDRLLSRF